MIKFDSYDQTIIYLVKCKILKDSCLYFDNNNELMKFIYSRYNVNYNQVEIDFNEIKLNDKLGELFAIIGKIINNYGFRRESL